MSFRANTVISILRGTVIDAYGDEADADTEVASGIPASILQRPVTGGRPVSGRADTERTYALRVWRPVDLRQDDRVKDRRGRIYVVTTVVPAEDAMPGLTSTRADLQRVT
jgi:hypothetical protein